jgi:CRISPR-associated endonuclease/helicase Cas3
MITAGDFGEFYEEVHGRKPFPWQRRLGGFVAKNGWPRLIALPTSTGKTSIIDVAVFQLALQCDMPAADRTAGLRTLFVVDRRVVVDDVAKHARRLAHALQAAEQGKSANPVLAEVASRLKSLGGSSPLKVSILRGGTYRDDTWADIPCQPLVCVTTVDQIGSRLLFRGYGVSNRRHPVHAGLGGCDSLLILDEAHLSNPFAQTLQAVVRYQNWGKAGLPGLRFVTMSATLSTRERHDEKPFELDEEDLADETLARRLNASKVAELREPADFEAGAAGAALELREHADVVAVVVNRVASARRVFDRLQPAGEAILLTGRVRPYDRDRLLDVEYGDRLAATPNVRARKPLFVVATQTVEVGADFDFDALVTEAAPLDALRQRFGRVNRLGNRQARSRAVILLRKLAKGEGDPIYGPPLADTWNWLKAHATKTRKTLAIDFGVLAMDNLLRGSRAENLFTARGRAPLMLPSHLDAWSQTNPRPFPDPDVAPFLHGEAALEAADAHLVWRADLKEEDAELWPRVLALAPPTMAEALPLPIWTLRRWLRSTNRGEEADAADIEGVSGGADGEEEAGYRPYLTWSGPGNAEQYNNGAGLVPGATIIVPSCYGGADEYGWAPGSTKDVPDIGDECWNKQAEAGVRRYRLRLHPEVLFAGDCEDSARHKAELSRWVKRLASPDPEESKAARSELLEYLAGAWAEGNSSRQRVLDGLKRSKLAIYPPETPGAVFTAQRRAALTRAKPPDYLKTLEDTDGETTDEEDDGSFTLQTPLDRHTDDVRRLARQFARACGINEGAAEDIELAARLHDLGKLDGRFQAMLRGGTFREEILSEPLAKSDFMTYGERQKAKRMSGYPKHARHELTSVIIARLGAVHVRAHDPDLVLHLIGTHHGYARPFPPVVDDLDPITVTAEIDGRTVNAPSDHRLYRLDSGWTDQFRRLIRGYGHWGLAYLEAILRRADCVASRLEEDQCTRSTATG